MLYFTFLHLFALNVMCEIADEAVKNNLIFNSTIASENDVRAMNSDVELCRNLRVYGYNAELLDVKCVKL